MCLPTIVEADSAPSRNRGGRRTGNVMSEKNFQKALMHLYITIDRYSSYSEAIFKQSALSRSEKQSLKQLMTSQRDGLLLFNQQLHNKRRRSIWHALPKSRDIVARQLETLLDAYASCPLPESARHPADAVRSFADYAGAQINSHKDVSKELEFIWFEAVYASVSLSLASTDFNASPPLQLSTDLRLSLEGDAALIPCTYDVLAAMKEGSLPGISGHRLKTYWFFMFLSRSYEVRILTIAPGLARVLKLFQSGLSLGDVLQALECETEKTAVSASIEKLLLLGAPFFSRACGSCSTSSEMIAR
jgi:hypothetical protein